MKSTFCTHEDRDGNNFFLGEYINRNAAFVAENWTEIGAAVLHPLSQQRSMLPGYRMRHLLKHTVGRGASVVKRLVPDKLLSLGCFMPGLERRFPRPQRMQVSRVKTPFSGLCLAGIYRSRERYGRQQSNRKNWISNRVGLAFEPFVEKMTELNSATQQTRISWDY